MKSDSMSFHSQSDYEMVAPKVPFRAKITVSASQGGKGKSVLLTKTWF